MCAILACYIDCGSNTEVGEDTPLEIVNIACDGDTIMVEVNRQRQPLDDYI
ncbi:MAG: hypothetical protein OXI63_01575 [Candidatus Poribacteria bacterium]|nr:hypothetical protein [Candidatus Poribacteria bacterium]